MDNHFSIDMKICYTWSKCDITWSNANWTFSECRLVEEIVSGIPSDGVPGEWAQPPWLQEEKPWDPYNQEKRKRFIRLLRRLKGEPEFDEQREVKTDIKITLNEVKFVVKAVKGIDIQILEE